MINENNENSVKKVIVITGDTLEFITNAVKELKEKSECKYIEFPERDKHPKVWSRELRQTLKSKEAETYLISTFNEDVLNLIGHMIYKKELNYKNVEVNILKKDSKINANYDIEGYLENYPVGYFLIDID